MPLLKISKYGVSWLLVVAVSAAATGLFYPPLAAGLAVLALCLAFFFRDPDRTVQRLENGILSPADGAIHEVSFVECDPVLGVPSYKIGIFLSFFDVHINRSPVSGFIEKIEYRKGRFYPAHRSDAGRTNENNLITIRKDTAGNTALVAVRQIAGRFARRIVCEVRENGKVDQGQKIGMIRLGSRTEIMIPSCYTPCVKPGQKVKAGLSVLAEIKPQK